MPTNFTSGYAIISESIEWFSTVENQAFSPSYDLAPRPPPPASAVSNLDRRHTGRLRNRATCWLERGGGVWARSWIMNYTDGENKVIYRSIHTYALKHFGMVWRSLSLSISTIILRGPFEEQLGKLATNNKNFKNQSCILKHKLIKVTKL